MTERTLYPPSDRYDLASGFDFTDGLFKNPDGTLVPRINSPMVIMHALKARRPAPVKTVYGVGE